MTYELTVSITTFIITLINSHKPGAPGGPTSPAAPGSPCFNEIHYYLYVFSF